MLIPYCSIFKQFEMWKVLSFHNYTYSFTSANIKVGRNTSHYWPNPSFSLYRTTCSNWPLLLLYPLYSTFIPPFLLFFSFLSPRFSLVNLNKNQLSFKMSPLLKIFSISQDTRGWLGDKRVQVNKWHQPI